MQQRIDQAEPATRPAAELAGKTAIVTGSTSGIGLGIAQAFAAAGMHVMLNGFGDKAEIEKIRGGHRGGLRRQDRLLRRRHVQARRDRRAWSRTRAGMLGKVDVLVNNAGIQHVEAIETFPVAKWDAIIAINLSSAFHAIRAVVPEMKARKWGRIINIASAHGLVASPFKSAYVAAKHGILGLTKTVALETAEHGITVNAICPGYVLHAAGAEADPRDGQGARHHRGAGDQGRAAARPADAPVRDHGADRRAVGVPVQRCRRIDHRHRAADRRRLDRAIGDRAGEVGLR